jgi:hypothetical protein
MLCLKSRLISGPGRQCIAYNVRLQLDFPIKFIFGSERAPKTLPTTLRSVISEDIHLCYLLELIQGDCVEEVVESIARFQQLLLQGLK